jgi:citrate lyase beta subunit
MAIVAARAYGLDILDGVYNDFRDEEGFREECEHGLSARFRLVDTPWRGGHHLWL